MRSRYARAAWLAALVVTWAIAAGAQDLEELVKKRQREEEEMRDVPGVETPTVLPRGAETRLRLPEGERLRGPTIAQDRRIDPEHYIVGPGDALQLYIWGEFDRDISFQVNPEGYVLVPTVGAFLVADQPLAEVRRQVLAAAATKYPGVEATFTLKTMRQVVVYLTGAIVGGDGQYTVTPITRVSDLVEMAGGFADEVAGTEEVRTASGGKVTRRVTAPVRPTGRRSIRVTHLDGSQESVDLAMFQATGDLSHNPYVRMGDVVHVGFRLATVYVYGAVNEEGPREYRPGDTVDDLLSLAGGLQGSAPLEAVEIWRFRAGTDSTQVISLLDTSAQMQTQLSTEQLATSLLQDDMLFVRTRSDWRQTPTAHAHGEVRFTGRYRIRPGHTTLSQFIAQAGGFTENANLVEARVIRTKYRAVADPELERLRSVVQAGGLADLEPEERAYLKSKEREERGRLAVDFERLFVNGDASQDILLQGGDVVLVPERRRTVSLSGQVQRPGLIDFEEGRRAGYYLAQGGGFGFDADKGGARLIRARTGQREEFDRNLFVEPGDEIWVPEKEYRDWWALVQGAMRSTAEALTLILLVRAI